MAPSLDHLLPDSTIRVVTHFLVHPESEMHFRALRRHTELSINQLQRELGRLQAMGLISRHEVGRQVRYRAVREHPSWEAFRILVREHARPGEVLRDALHDVEGIQAAFVFGSQVRGNARPESDVDLLLVAEREASGAIGDALLRAQSVLGRSVDLKRYTPEKLARATDRGNRFLREVLEGPKEWLVGSPESFPSHAPA